MKSARRICSLLPSATEIVYALGLQDRLVAVTHECDFPPEAAKKPRVTSSIIDSQGLSAREIDAAVRQSLENEATIYQLDAGLLEQLQPDLVLTQELCEVCAVGTGEVQRVVAALPAGPDVVSLEPHTLNDVFDSILQVGRLTGALRRAIEVTNGLRARVERVRAAVVDARAVRVLTLEWLDPAFVGGHWVPEMVEIAGGQDVLGEAGRPSREATWEEIVGSDPEVIIAMPCGFGLERTVWEMENASLPAGWDGLPAVRNGRVFAVDGSSYFNRPGPRLVDGVEILAGILHPDAFSGTPSGAAVKIEQPAAQPG